ncbi:hypothetical protein GCM10012275_24600 [Longimycelium tulufanense]|uniref:Uncharacterized protein n=1 Tax=Longimycelium tulufanense TaxID=907463 RepID=A0A8J3CAZ4_9PSEU|nr:hypothetical protein [Longimycelium tulufanense]GGM52690.1 hypothetical protein GCM10012275_24600 [Longimycelium tulufanense]
MRAATSTGCEGATRDVLVGNRADSTALLRRLRSDPVLGPIAVQFLVTEGELAMEDLTEREHFLGIAEQMIRLLEMAGPDAAADVLEESPDVAAEEVPSVVLDSGHPNETGLEEPRTLILEPLRERGSRRFPAHPLGGLRGVKVLCVGPVGRRGRGAGHCLTNVGSRTVFDR